MFSGFILVCCFKVFICFGVFLGCLFSPHHTRVDFFNKSAAFCWEDRASAADSRCLKGGGNVDSNKRWEELILTARTDLSPLLQINRKKTKTKLAAAFILFYLLPFFPTFSTSKMIISGSL